MNTTMLEDKLNEIEAEMKRIGLWQSEPLPESAYDIKEAFGADTMTLSQWLQFIFIPNAKELIKTNGPWPQESQVGIYATQQYLFFRPTSEPGVLTTQGSVDQSESHLVQLLREFDDLINEKPNIIPDTEPKKH